MSLCPKHTEARFEDAIEGALLAHGYAKREPMAYDAPTGLFSAGRRGASHPTNDCHFFRCDALA
jgi:hypothetical protein